MLNNFNITDQELRARKEMVEEKLAEVEEILDTNGYDKGLHDFADTLASSLEAINEILETRAQKGEKVNAQN